MSEDKNYSGKRPIRHQEEIVLGGFGTQDKKEEPKKMVGEDTISFRGTSQENLHKAWSIWEDTRDERAQRGLFDNTEGYISLPVNSEEIVTAHFTRLFAEFAITEIPQAYYLLWGRHLEHKNWQQLALECYDRGAHQSGNEGPYRIKCLLAATRNRLDRNIQPDVVTDSLEFLASQVIDQKVAEQASELMAKLP